jgi:hypothetical protein
MMCEILHAQWAGSNGAMVDASFEAPGAEAQCSKLLLMFTGDYNYITTRNFE